jgi:hypothetical protein
MFPASAACALINVMHHSFVGRQCSQHRHVPASSDDNILQVCLAAFLQATHTCSCKQQRQSDPTCRKGLLLLFWNIASALLRLSCSCACAMACRTKSNEHHVY